MLRHALVATIKQLASSSENEEYLGEILRPSAGLMDLPEFKQVAESYVELLKAAGKQLIENNKIDQDIHDKLHESWISQEDFMVNSNNYFHSILPQDQR